MKEYRCTRNALYLHFCDGRMDLNARNGYYIRTKSSHDALQIMAQRFPQEVSQGFTVEEWKDLPWLSDECVN